MIKRIGLRPILLASPVGHADDREYEYRPINIERYKFSPLADIALFIAVLRLVLNERPALVHLINIKPYLFGGLATRVGQFFGWQGKVIITVPGLGRLYDGQSKRISISGVRRKAVEFFLRIATQGASVTFETEHDRDVWIARKLIDSSQATITCGTGLDLDRFTSVRPICERKSLKVLFAGRLLRSKGLDVFLQAAARINKPDIEMAVAGVIEDDPDALTLEDLRAVTQIKFLGHVVDMPQLLAGTDVVVLPSRYNEGIPRILIEAAACGAALVATRFAGSEMLIEDGKTGFFLAADELEHQSEQLDTIIRRLNRGRPECRMIGHQAAEYVRRKGFSVQDVSRTFLEVYSAALKRSSFSS